MLRFKNGNIDFQTRNLEFRDRNRFHGGGLRCCAALADGFL